MSQEDFVSTKNVRSEIVYRKVNLTQEKKRLNGSKSDGSSSGETNLMKFDTNTVTMS